MGKPNLWVVIAAYNERGSIGEVVRKVLPKWPQVVVVNDGSRDETGEEARAAGAVVVDHPFNLGQGAALGTGILYALTHGAEYVATFDADGQHRVEDLTEMLDTLLATGADIALGSRFLGNAKAIPFHRKLVLKLAVWFTWLTTGVKMTDAHNGLRVMTADAARKIRITQNRMAHASEIIELIGRHHLKFVEVPVTILYTDYSMAKGQPLANAVNIVLELLSGRLTK